MRALLTEARSPHVVLSLSFSYSGWFHWAQGLSAFTFLPGLLRPTREGAQGGAPSAIREGACSLREQSKSHAGALLAFWINQGILASFLSSIFLTVKFFPYHFLLLSILLPTLSSRGNPWILPGLDPGRLERPLGKELDTNRTELRTKNSPRILGNGQKDSEPKGFTGHHTSVSCCLQSHQKSSLSCSCHQIC